MACCLLLDFCSSSNPGWQAALEAPVGRAQGFHRQRSHCESSWWWGWPPWREGVSETRCWQHVEEQTVDISLSFCLHLAQCVPDRHTLLPPPPCVSVCVMLQPHRSASMSPTPQSRSTGTRRRSARRWPRLEASCPTASPTTRSCLPRTTLAGPSRRSALWCRTATLTWPQTS